jgi:outer membrane protein OmpA-like peptidoglycan-associated protein
VGRIARESITVAVRTLDISEERAAAAERRAEIARRDAEVRRVTETATDLSSELADTQSRLKASEIARANAQDQLDRTMREAADARAENRSLRSENDRLRNDVDRLNQDLTAARRQISDLQTQYSSTTARLTETSSRVEAMERAEREKQMAEARRRDFAALQASIAAIATVKPSGTGFVATLPDSFFLPNQATLHVRAKSKMDSLAGVIAAHRDVTFVIEGHSDSRANADSFALGRAQAVADYLAALGVARNSFRVESRGSAFPISTRKTIAARGMNRRVELVFSGPQ